MKDWEGTLISKSIADRGISEWSTMAEALEREVPKLAADVEACLRSAPWGGGSEGVAFYQAHFRDDGPTEMLTHCTQLSRDIMDAGDRLRDAIRNTRQTDVDLGHDLNGMIREV